MKKVNFLLFLLLVLLYSCGTERRNNYILLLDNSLSIQPELMEKYIAIITGHILPKLGKHDCITVQFIDECSMTQSERIYHLDLAAMDFSKPEVGLNHREDSIRARRERFLKDTMQSKLGEIILQKREERKACGQYTDILNALRTSSSLLIEKEQEDRWEKLDKEAQGKVRYDYHNTIIIFSDMVNEGRDTSYDFSVFQNLSTKEVEAKLDKLKAEEKIPDLQGTDVMVYGATSTSGAGELANIQIENVRHFWERYFKEAGATVKAYGYDSQKEIEDYLLSANN